MGTARAGRARTAPAGQATPEQTKRRTGPPTPKPTPAPTPIVIDPRIKQRRIEVKRDEGRRRLKTLLVSVGVVALVAVAVGAIRSPLLDVDHVVVTGASHTTAADVAHATRLDRSPQLIDVDTGGVARRVARLPWVATATATRRWPATVAVTVTERTVAASIPAANGGWAVVDGTGRVLELQPGRPDAMPSVSGAAPAGPPGTRLGTHGRDAMKVAAGLPPEVRSITVEIVVTGDGSIDLDLLGEAVVKLGDTSELAAKLASVVTVLGDLQGKPFKVLDVRVPRAPVLTRR